MTDIKMDQEQFMRFMTKVTREKVELRSLLVGDEFWWDKWDAMIAAPTGLYTVISVGTPSGRHSVWTVQNQETGKQYTLRSKNLVTSFE